jgi:opacity protein-like surface antigen
MRWTVGQTSKLSRQEKRVRKTSMIFFVLLMAALACAQSNEVALTGGGYFAASNPLDLGVAWALEGSVAHRVFGVPFISIYGELPIAGSFSSSIPTINGLTVAKSYNSLFITPGVRLRIWPSFPISPYLVAGVGYSRFNRKLFDGSTSADSGFAWDVGGGLDVKVLSFISLRGEVRDFNSGNLGLESLATGRQNNLFVTGGVAVRF